MILFTLSAILFYLAWSFNKAGDSHLIAGLEDPSPANFHKATSIAYFGAVLSAMLWVFLTVYEHAMNVAL